MFSFKARRGFTLIELLIVVAIIGILAAIAIPNFLQAQTRAKVSRSQAEMRNVAVALESYYVDHGLYPTAGNDTLLPFPADPFEGHLPLWLTTPVTYISTLQPEIFPNAALVDPEELPFHYSEGRTNAFLGEPDFLQNLWATVYGSGGNQETKYMMFSHGPDLDHDENAPLPYDPSNGTVSSGDIYYWGPGIGLK